MIVTIVNKNIKLTIVNKMNLPSVYNRIIMVKEYGRVVSIRIPQKLNDRIEAAVATGKYRNKADYIMAALRVFDDGLGEIETGGGVQPLQNDPPEN